MRCSAIYGMILSLVFVGVATTASAQETGHQNWQEPQPSLLDVIQSRLKGGIFGPVEQMPGHKTPDATDQATVSEDPRPTPRRGTYGSRPTPAKSRPYRPSHPVAVNRNVQSTAPSSAASQLPSGAGVPITELPRKEQPTEQPRVASASGTLSSRMHQRLSAFRNSTFTPANETNESQPVSPLREAPPAEEAPSPMKPAEEPTLAESTPEPRPTLAPRRTDGLSTLANLPTEPEVVEPTPKYANEAAPSAMGQVEPEPTLTAESELPAQPVEQEAAEPSVSPRVLVAETRPSQSPQVLFTQQSPVLSVKTLGPEHIDVGREATFEVRVENSGTAAADELIVLATLPQWAELAGAEPSTGAVGSELADDGTRLFSWNVGRLAPQGSAIVRLNVIARESRPFDLAVNWHHAPAASGAKINVLQPALQLAMEGPDEVLFGKEQIYRLVLANDGTGDARDVVLSLLPEGTGQEQPAVQPIGDLLAGESRTIEIELTARNEGELTIVVDATAEGDVNARLAESVRVLRPALAVHVEAPEFQFVGKQLTYQIVVNNPGTAAAEDVSIEAVLPESVRYLACTEDGVVGQDRVHWEIGGLAPNESRTLQIQCEAKSAGLGRLDVVSVAADAVQARGDAAVMIDAIADLALQVIDPAGPVAVGTEALYTLKVENRGSKAAQDIEIVAYFSHGIEPVDARGVKYRIGPGQIVFDTIASIGPGESQEISLTARADATGNHIIRAEVSCKPLGTRLVAEESTYFYGKRPAQPMQVAPTQPATADEGVLTADRRDAASTEATPQE